MRSNICQDDIYDRTDQGMSECRTIAIVFHETATDEDIRTYRISYCTKAWEQQGIDVEIVRGVKARVAADLVIPQIDLSVVPRPYRRLFGLPGAVVNRGVVDIRKSSFSENLVRLEDDYDGAVIVKTDANHGGEPEDRAYRRLSFYRRVLPRLARRVQKLGAIASGGFRSPLARARAIRSDEYPVYASKRQVPPGVFGNSRLIVEKFRPETDGRYYYLRSYAFLGSEGLAVRTRSEHPAVKGGQATDLEFVPVDDSIVAMREELGIDYGKFDYVMHDGEAVLLDVNVTPTFGDVYSPEVREEIAMRLAKGIIRWFPGGGW